jgi:transcriptional regulator with AAA-type ATPase domain
MGIQPIVYGKQTQRLESTVGGTHFVTAHRPLKIALEALPTQGPGGHLLLAGSAGSGRATFAKTAWRKIRQTARPFLYVSCSSIRNHRDLFRLLRQAEGGDLVLADMEFFPSFFLFAWLQEIEHLASVRIIGIYECQNREAGAAFFSRWDLLFEQWVYIPSLRERREDIPLLVAQTLHPYPSISIAPDALEKLEASSWPGETAQLICHIKSLVQQGLKQQRFIITDANVETMPAYGHSELAFFTVCQWVREEGLLSMAHRWGMKTTAQMVEAAILALTMEACLGCTRQAAHLLQMPATTLLHRKKVLQQMVHLLDFGPLSPVQ